MLKTITSFNSVVIGILRSKTLKRTFTSDEAQALGETIGINFAEIDLKQFRIGLTVELEQGWLESGCGSQA